ncbi:MAG: hypothetical protein ACR2FS_19510 [Phormidesmis sp.]
MDDKQLAEQLEKTGNLMDLLNDADWLRENAAVEAECSGYVEAGAGLESYVERLKNVSPDALRAQKKQVKLLSILLPALHDWLDSWELGLSFEAVYAEAQRLVYGHLIQAMKTQASWIESLLSQDAQTAPVQVKEKLAELLRPEDWQVLAKVAAQDMEKRILHRAQVEAEVPISV